jgi:hypothetical protein
MRPSLSDLFATMPEPASLLLLGVGLLAVALLAHWRMRGR